MTQASIGRSRTVNYATNLMGEVVKRWESASGTGGGAPAEYWYRYAGKEMGKVGNDGTLYNSYISSITQRQTQAGQGAFEFGRTGGTPEADFGSRLEGISSYNQGSAAGTITARGGETLQAVAASLWGDSGLWYKLAQANGLSGDAALSAGQTLRIPAGVVRNTFNAATITPTDPADTLGDVNPTSPQAAPPKKQRCGVVGTILLVVIAIAVTVITKGAAAKFATALVKAATGAATLSGAAAVAATGIGYGLAAAAGSVVSQAVGVATGIQDKFSWKSVGMAFISGAVGGGMGDIGGKSIGAAMIRGAASSAISQGIGVALGLQDKFSWAAVAAAGVGAGAAQAVGRTQFAQNLTAKSELAGDIYVGMADAMGQAATLSLIQGTDFGDNLIASLPSVLGGAIGRQLGGVLSKTFAKTAEPKPLVIEPINEKIEVDLSRATLDPVTAKLPPENQQNVQNGPSNINAFRQRLALTPEGEDFQFRMQAVGDFEYGPQALRREIDRKLNKLVPDIETPWEATADARALELSKFGGKGIKSYLVSRRIEDALPTDAPKNHMFVLVYDHDKGTVEARFSYGPEKSGLRPGHLVPLTGVASGTNTDDDVAVKLLQSDLNAAVEAGMSISEIKAPYQQVIKAGKQINASLGSRKINYFLLPWRVTGPLGHNQSASNVANSNSAAYAVAQLSLKMSGITSVQLLPRGTDNPGWNAYRVVAPPTNPRSSIRAKR